MSEKSVQPFSPHSNLGPQESLERGPLSDTLQPSQRYQGQNFSDHVDLEENSPKQKLFKSTPDFQPLLQETSTPSNKAFWKEEIRRHSQGRRSDESSPDVTKMKDLNQGPEGGQKLSQGQLYALMHNKAVRQCIKLELNSFVNAQKTIQQLTQKIFSRIIFKETDKSHPIKKQQKHDEQYLIDPITMVRYMIEMKRQDKSQAWGSKDFHFLIRDIASVLYSKAAIKDYTKRLIIHFIEWQSFQIQDAQQHPLPHELQERYNKFEMALVKNKLIHRIAPATQQEGQQHTIYTEISENVEGTRLSLAAIMDKFVAVFKSLTVLLKKSYKNMGGQILIKWLFQEFNSFQKQLGISYDFIKVEKNNNFFDSSFQKKVNLCLALNLLKTCLIDISTNNIRPWKILSLKSINKDLKLMDHQEKMHITKRILFHAPLTELQRTFQTHSEENGSRKSQFVTQSSQYLFDPESNFQKLNKNVDTKDPQFFFYYFFDLIEFIKKILKLGFSLPLQKDNLGVHDGRFVYKLTKELTINKNIVQISRINQGLAKQIDQIIKEKKKDLNEKVVGLVLGKMFPALNDKNIDNVRRQHFCQIQQKIFFALGLLRQFQQQPNMQKYEGVFNTLIAENHNLTDFFLYVQEKQIHNLYKKASQAFKELSGIKRPQLKKQQRGLLQEVLEIKCEGILFGLYSKLVKGDRFNKTQQYKIFLNLIRNRPSTANRVYKWFMQPSGISPRVHLQQVLHNLRHLKKQQTIFNGIVGVTSYWSKNMLVQSWMYEDLDQTLFTKMDGYTHAIAIQAWKRMTKPLKMKDEKADVPKTTLTNKEFVSTIFKIIHNATSADIDLPVLLLRHFLMTVLVNQQQNLQGIVAKLHLVPSLVSLLSITNDPKVPTEYNMLNHMISQCQLPTPLRNELIRNIFFASLLREDDNEVSFLRQMLRYFDLAAVHNIRQPQKIVKYISDFLFYRKPQSQNQSFNEYFLDNGVLVDDYKPLTIADIQTEMRAVLHNQRKQQDVSPYYIDLHKIILQKYGQSSPNVVLAHTQNIPVVTRGSHWQVAPQIVIRGRYGDYTCTLHKNHYTLPNLHIEKNNDVRHLYNSLFKMIYHNMAYLYQQRVNNLGEQNMLINSVLSVIPTSNHPDKLHEDFVVVTYHQDHRLHRVKDYKHQQNGPYYHRDHQLLVAEVNYKKKLFSRLKPRQQRNFMKHLLAIPRDARKIALQLLPLSLPSLDFASNKQIHNNTLNGGIHYTMQQFRNYIPGQQASFQNDVSIIPVFNELSGCILYPIVPNQQLRRMNIEGYSSYVNNILQAPLKDRLLKKDNDNQLKNYYAETSYSAFCQQRYHRYYKYQEKEADIKYRQKYDLGQFALIVVELHSPIDSQKCYMRYRAAVQNYKKDDIFYTEQERENAVCDFKQQLQKMVADTRFSYLNEDQAKHFRRILVRQLEVEVEKRLSYDEMMEQLRNHVLTLIE